jgi:hypothetical protein
VRELGNGGGNLEPLVEDDLLSLESNVLGPFDESGQVSLGWDVTTWEGQLVCWQNDSPIPKDLGVFSKRGFWAGLEAFLVPSVSKSVKLNYLKCCHSHGAEAGLDFPLAALGWRGH